VTDLSSGKVYSETVVHSPAPQFINDVPYQLAIIDLADGRRLTARIDGPTASIGDPVDFIELRDQVPYFRKRL
jgi:uncharacterized OB-fold protein